MSTDRRQFIGAAASGAAALAGLPRSLFGGVPRDVALDVTADEWNLTWPTKLSGKYKAVFDCADPESGYGVWRAASWARHATTVLNAAPAMVTPAIVLRHNAIILAMQQSFWDKYNIGETKKVTHPLTLEPTKKNPVLLDEKDGLPEPFNMAGLHKQLAHGVVVLACNLALQDCVDLIKNTDKVSDDEARKRAIAYLIPGVILQPSGVFAAIMAQEAGAAYVKAS
jgi:hypothetical protein